MNMHTEPIRLPAWAFAAIAVIGPPAATILAGGDIRQAIATAILGLVASGGVIARAESVRQFTDSPATMAKQRHEAEAIFAARFPDDVVTGMFTDDV